MRNSASVMSMASRMSMAMDDTCYRLSDPLSLINIERDEINSLDFIHPEWTQDEVVRILNEFLQYQEWNDQQVSSLTDSLAQGTCRLLTRGEGVKQLVHETRLIMLFLVDRQSQRILQQVAHPGFKHGL